MQATIVLPCMDNFVMTSVKDRVPERIWSKPDLKRMTCLISTTWAVALTVMTAGECCGPDTWPRAGKVVFVRSPGSALQAPCVYSARLPRAPLIKLWEHSMPKALLKLTAGASEYCSALLATHCTALAMCCPLLLPAGAAIPVAAKLHPTDPSALNVVGSYVLGFAPLFLAFPVQWWLTKHYKAKMMAQYQQYLQHKAQLQQAQGTGAGATVKDVPSKGSAGAVGPPVSHVADAKV